MVHSKVVLNEDWFEDLMNAIRDSTDTQLHSYLHSLDLLPKWVYGLIPELKILRLLIRYEYAL